MFFKTETSSVYEVNSSSSKIRRVYGKTNPTQRVGENEWRKYESISKIEVGLEVIIIWTKETYNFVPGTIPTTITSQVVAIYDSRPDFLMQN